MTAPKIPMTISLGNILTIAAMLMSLAAAWFSMTARLEVVDERSRSNLALLQRHSEMIAQAQIDGGLTGERLRSIETSLSRIEAGVGDLTRYLRGEARP